MLHRLPNVGVVPCVDGSGLASLNFTLRRIIGDEIPHAHIWVFPSNEAQGDKEDLAGNAEEICVALAKY